MTESNIYTGLLPVVQQYELTFEEKQVRQALHPVLQGAETDPETGEIVFPENRLEILDVTDEEEVSATLEMAVYEARARLVNISNGKKQAKRQQLEQAVVVIKALRALYEPVKPSPRRR